LLVSNNLLQCCDLLLLPCHQPFKIRHLPCGCDSVPSRLIHHAEQCYTLTLQPSCETIQQLHPYIRKVILQETQKEEGYLSYMGVRKVSGHLHMHHIIHLTANLWQGQHFHVQTCMVLLAVQWTSLRVRGRGEVYTVKESYPLQLMRCNTPGFTTNSVLSDSGSWTAAVGTSKVELILR
jgi:hypothetical protein